MLKKIKDTIDKFSLPAYRSGRLAGRQGMLKKGNTVLVAVSGGPDSVCLLLVLNSLKKELGMKLFAAHLNHLLRGAESDKDQRYVERLTNKLNIPLLTDSKNVARFAKDKKLSIEQAARELRYDFLLQAAKSIGANKIAMGHTKDDQAETLLMRLFRGAGLRGLRSIPAVRKISPNISIIRPLIETSREEVIAFLKKKKIHARLDSTNVKTAFLRNRLRHKLLPQIEKSYSPRIKEILARTADSLDVDYDYLTKQQQKAFNRIAQIKKGGSVNLSIKRLKILSISLKRGVVRLAIENVKGDLNRIDYRHWERIEDLIEEGGASLNLPDGVRVIRKAKTLQFTKNRVNSQLSENRELTLFSTISESPPKAFSKSPNIEYFDAVKIKFPLKVRFRKPADKMKPLGMKRYKRLQDIFVDDKIKAERRNKIPIIVDARDRIVWVCGVRMSEDFKVTPRTKKCLRLVVETS